jgi:hypothetical protein
MDGYNRQQLETALKAGKISTDEDTINKLDRSLFVLGITYLNAFGYINTIALPAPSRELKDLNKAVKKFLASENVEFELNLLPKPISMELLSTIFRSISQYVSWRDFWARNRWPKSRRETEVLIGLYETYVELSGRRGLSDNGPAIRFMTECASILGMAIPQGMRRRVQIAIKAGKKVAEKRTSSAIGQTVSDTVL